MKIAFVSQPIDSVLPPYQNSVGACTYGSACALARSHEVVVYGSTAGNGQLSNLVLRNVKFRFVQSAATDSLLCKVRGRISQAVRLQPVSTSPLYFPNYGAKVAQELSKEHFDVIHIQHSGQFAPVIRKFNPKAKIVLHLHAEWFSQSKREQLLQRVHALDLLTTVSDYVSERVRLLLPALEKPCVTHYNGFDPLEFALEKGYDAPSQRRELRIMFAGGISPHKGIHVLFDAFKLVAAKFPTAQLCLVGPAGTYPLEENFDVTERQLLAELAPFYNRNLSFARKLLSPSSVVVPDYISELKARLPADLADKVLFPGKITREALIEHFYDTDLFVFPSLFAEGFGLPPVEAMAAGTAVVGTRSGAIVETIEDGLTGLLVEKNNPKALAEAIMQLLDNAGMREKMGRAGRSRAFQHFTWDHVTAKMASTYEQLVRREPIQTTRVTAEMDPSLVNLRSSLASTGTSSNSIRTDEKSPPE
jgi:glycosyltransferase involved in cell wall biosynthesis